MSEKRKLVTKAQFAYYKERVLFWMGELNQLDWTITGFIHEDIYPNAAQVRYNYSNRGVSFVLTTHLELKPSRTWIDDTALHEVGHLVAAHLENLAERRFLVEDEIDVAKEELTCILTRVISKYYHRRTSKT